MLINLTLLEVKSNTIIYIIFSISYKNKLGFLKKQISISYFFSPLSTKTLKEQSFSIYLLWKLLISWNEMYFCPRFLTVGFFFSCCVLFIGSPESFKAHYTDNTCVSNAPAQPLKQKFSGWKWTSRICKFNCLSSFSCFKVHMKEMMKKRYILEYISPLFGIEIPSTYSELSRKIYILCPPKAWEVLLVYVCVCVSCVCER